MVTKAKLPDHYRFAVTKKMKEVSKLCEEIYGFISENGYDTIDFSTDKIFVFVASHDAMNAAKTINRIRSNNEKFPFNDSSFGGNISPSEPERGHNS